MFQIRGEQIAALRRKRIGDALIELTAPIFGGALWDPTGQSILLEDSLGSRGRLGFDLLGYLSTYTSPLGRTWQLTNTPQGKPLRLLTPSGYAVSMTYNAEGLLDSFATSTQSRTSLFYDRRRWVGSSFADGTWDGIEYSPWNAVARLTNRLGAQVACEYDEHRRLVAITDGNGNKTKFLYGDWSRPDAVIYPNGNGEAFAYSNEGKLNRIVQDDISIAVEVNAAGRPTSLIYSDGTQLRYDYGDAGMITTADDGDSKSTFVYNDHGQLAQEIAGDNKHQFIYDGSHRLIETEVLGLKTRFLWDADQRLAGYVDWNGNEHIIDYLPDDRGHVTTGPGDVRSFTQLDIAGRLANLNVTARGTSHFSLECNYNAEGRLSASHDNIFGDRAFTYDAEGKLLYADASSTERREAFSYDPAGNLVVVNGQRLIFDPANQLLQHNNENLRWDDRGNIISQSGPQGAWAYRYNARNQMIASATPAGVETLYAYDALGRRTSKRTGSRETRFLWVGEQLAAELHLNLSTGAVTRQDFLYHPETGAPLATCIDGEVYTFATDHLGTPRALFTQTGEIVWLAELSAFGTATVLIDKVHNPLRFQGQYHDPETNFHYNRFRYYAPQHGRYTTRDPLTFLAGTNHYQYAEGDPINNTDASGLINWRAMGAIAGSVVAAVAVGALVAVAAPALGIAAVPALLIGGALAGAAAGATGEALNEQLNGKCVSSECIWKAAGFGAISGLAAAAVFIGLGPAAPVLAYLSRGATAGAVGYVTDYVAKTIAGQHPVWSTAGLLVTVGVSAATAGIIRAAKGGPSEEPPVAGSSGGLRRPYIRQSVRAEVEARAPKTADGRFIDPNTGEPIDGPYDLGHKPGHEFRTEKANAEAEGLTQQEFNDRMNDPDLYQIEDPSANRSHQFEQKD